MDRFLVVSPHAAEECKDAIMQVLAIGYITHFDWGCLDGDHTGWATVEASSPQEALMAVPTAQRRNARVIRITKFSPEEIERMHE